MFGLPDRTVIIDGHTIPRRRFTVWAWGYFLLLVAVPVIGGGALIDYGIYAAFFR